MLRHVVEGIGPGIRVSDFGNPVEALRWSDRQRRRPAPARLPHARDGRAASSRADSDARLSRRDVPIVLISVVGDEPVRQAALEAGVIDFLVKPVRPRELRSRCKNLLQLRQQGESVKERARSLEQRVLPGMHEVERARARDAVPAGQGDRIPRSRHRHPPAAHVALRRADRRRRSGVPEEEVRMLDAGRAAARYRQDRHSGCGAARSAASLTDEEFAVMRRHPLIGYEILRDSQSRFVQMGATIALRHHERWDGIRLPGRAQGRGDPAAGAHRRGRRRVRRADLGAPVQARLERRRGLRLHAGEPWHAF